MITYPKIQTVWKRDERGKIIEGQYSTPEFEYLADCPWEWTEKVDGTNIRVYWPGVGAPQFGGRTDNAQLPTPLLNHLSTTFTTELMESVFGRATVTLFGEGYGAGIQKVGHKYRSDQGFILFDVLIDPWWLRRPDVQDVAHKLGIPMVPLLGKATLREMCDRAAAGMDSLLGDLCGEGIVARTPVGLLDRDGTPIMVKIKAKDYA